MPELPQAFEAPESALQHEALVAPRLRKLATLRAASGRSWANDFRISATVAEFCLACRDTPQQPSDADGAPHHLAGRVLAVNSFGKTAFVRVQDHSSDCVGPNGAPVGPLQIYVRRDRLSPAAWSAFEQLDLGDFVGVVGHAMRTKTGELSLAADDFTILTKALRPMPEKWHGLADTEVRYRQRYLDLIANRSTRAVFRKRAQIIAWLRTYLGDRGFLEVETPMMHALAGGAAAKPFVTHHNALNQDIYLRVAPELFLKRLVVGGFERVFEINRNFRNEGLSTLHNPEFTMLEFYQAYISYEEVMDMAEEILHGLATSVCGGTHLTWGEHDISLQRPFARLSMLDAIAKHGGPAPAEVRDPDSAARALAAVGIDAAHMSAGERVLALFEHFAEKRLIAPTFVYAFPADVSPLARRQDADPFFVDRFELFVGGHELANAFSELNDPIDQRGRFAAQKVVDEDYVRALEHGMPPTAGFGMGIDRLVMLLTGVTSIRDVILFPQLRPTA